MRRKIVMATWLTLGLYRPWKDWRCVNDVQFNASNDLHSLRDKAERLITKYLEQKRYVARVQSEIDNDPHMVRGMSRPYYITVPNKDSAFKKKPFLTDPKEGWQDIFRPDFLKSMGFTVNGRHGATDDLRAKLGMPEIKSSKRAQVAHVGLPEPIKIEAGKSDMDSEIEYRPAPPAKSNNQNKQRNRTSGGNNNNQQHDREDGTEDPRG